MFRGSHTHLPPQNKKTCWQERPFWFFVLPPTMQQTERKKTRCDDHKDVAFSKHAYLSAYSALCCNYVNLAHSAGTMSLPNADCFVCCTVSDATAPDKQAGAKPFLTLPAVSFRRSLALNNNAINIETVLHTESRIFFLAGES